MRWILTVIILGLSSLAVISSAYAQEKVDSLYFSAEIPDSWTYTESAKSSVKDLIGIDSFSSLVLVPTEFGTYLIEDEEPIELENGSAAIIFSKDSDYSVKNAPLDLYVKYRIDREDVMNMTSQQDTEVGQEKAIKIEGNGLDDYKNIKFADYLILHNDEPYHLRYMANVNDFETYLPDFEEMVKSFIFTD